MLAVLVASGALLYYYLRLTPSEQTSTNASDTSRSAGQSDQNQSQRPRADTDTKQQSSNTDSPSVPTATKDTTKQKVQLTASTNTSNGIVYLRGGVNYPVQDGSCYALLTGPSSQSLRKDTTLLQNPASTDCKTISVSKSELSPGKWTYTLYYISDNYEGASDAISFSI